MLRSIALLVVFAGTVFAQNTAERFADSIRRNDLALLRSLVKEHGVAVADSRRQTPLMFAAGFGSYDAVKLLVEAGAEVKSASASGITALHLCVGDIKKVRLLIDLGADVHARSQMGRTPLLVAAYTHGAYETVKLLLSKGADINSADSVRLTPLIAAANVNDTATVKLLIAAGADVTARANTAQAATALMAAGHNGNLELTRLLLAKNVPVDVSSTPGSGIVKNGTVQFGSVTALHTAALGSNPQVVKLLLEAGANPDAQDMRGMTPLMFSISTDRPNVEIIRLMLRKGADVSIKSKAGETALDWARKFNHPAVLGELKLERRSTSMTQPPVNHPFVNVRTAVERSLALLRTSDSRMLSDGGCIACHQQPVTLMAVKLSRDRGWNAPNSAAALQTLETLWLNADQPLLQGQEGGGSPDTMLYNGLALAASGVPASWKTDVLVHYLIAKQRSDGNWHGVGASRAPIQDGDFSRTAISIRVLKNYAIPARAAEITARVKRAADWLAAQVPLSTEDRIMQLLGFKWAEVNSRLRDTRIQELIKQQQPDGGWSQTPYLASDAYATGQVLYTLHELGTDVSDPAFRRGVEYLLRTQHEDGSWFVKSRAMKIQPYFESGFPYDHDQWISSAATAWAAMALSLTSHDGN